MKNKAGINMAEKIFTVEELATLCQVDRETIRRWRNKGVRGVCLEATDSTVLRGKPISFTADAIERFAKVNPKVMTPALRKALGGAETGKVRMDLEGMNFSYHPEEQSFLRRVLIEKKAALLRELEQTEKTLAKLEGEE